MSNTRNINLPTPLEHQLDILRSPARFKQAVCGRRAGKTLTALYSAVEGHGPGRCFHGCVDGANILWISRNFPQSSNAWRLLKKATAEAAESVSEVERRIELPGDGCVTVRSAEDPDSLRGEGYDGVVFDECAFCRESVWTEAVRPSLADRRGWALFISTPNGLNWFYRLFIEAANLENWQTWQHPTSINPLIEQSELDQAQAQSPVHVWQQEFLAEFVSAAGARIQRDWLRYYRSSFERYQLLSADGQPTASLGTADMMRIITVDPAGSTADIQSEKRGKGVSYSVIATFDIHRKTGTLLWANLRRGRWEIPQLCNEIEAAYKADNPEYVGVENQGLGLAVYQALKLRPIALRALKPGGKGKVERATKALVLLEQGKVYLPSPELGRAWLKPLEDELCTWTGARDDIADQVDCLAYAAMEAETAQPVSWGGVIKAYGSRPDYGVGPDSVILTGHRRPSYQGRVSRPSY